MKQSLEQLLSQLPTYMRDKNDEVYILTIQPSALVDQHSRWRTKVRKWYRRRFKLFVISKT